MKLQIDLSIPLRPILSDFEPVFFMGSCFAEYQSERCSQLGFPVHANPFGIVYNPLSMERILARIADREIYDIDELTEWEGRWFHPDHHGTLEFDDAEAARATINAILNDSHHWLRQARLVVLTLGTALVFKHIESDRKVGNCHRIPSNHFERLMLEPKEVVKLLQRSAEHIRRINPQAEIVWTISPVRHLRSGVVNSSLSKAILRTAIYEAGMEALYFPSFEVFIDQLRDYRFSQEDLAHPTEQAQEYIWERFVECVCTPQLQGAMAEVIAFRKLEAHIPVRDPARHADTLRLKRESLLKQHPKLQL